MTKREQNIRDVASRAERHWHGQKLRALAEKWRSSATGWDTHQSIVGDVRADTLRHLAQELEALIAEREQ